MFFLYIIHGSAAVGDSMTPYRKHVTYIPSYFQRMLKCAREETGGSNM